MTTKSYLSPADLPLKPHPIDGQPRPPQAPRGDFSRPATHGSDYDTDPTNAPAPPEGEGPVLARYRTSRVFGLKVAAFMFVLTTVGVIAMHGFTMRWMGVWWVWVAILLCPVLAYFSLPGTACSAGAEWVRRDRGGWVRLYELTKITAHYRSNALHLDFRDSAGHLMQISSTDLQSNPELWDLVYNGILHSVIAGGAEISGRLHSALQVPRPWPDQNKPGDRQP